MTPANTLEPTPRNVALKSDVTCRRIRFVQQAPADAEVVARFVDPKAMVAISEPLDPPSFQQPAPWPEPLDQLEIVVSSSASGADPTASGWLNPPEPADAPLPVSISIGRGRLSWRPGRALIEGMPSRANVLEALVHFAFYESELRRLEAAVVPFEASAPADASGAYRIESGARGNWARFGAAMESLAVVRLTFARLEPRLLSPSRRLPVPSRRLFRQLCRRAAIEDRLSAITERSEACEDLYEGAVDRLREHRWYRRGNLLEIIIIILLLIEVIQLGGDTALRWIQGFMY
jgi:hypothetical protein